MSVEAVPAVRNRPTKLARRFAVLGVGLLVASCTNERKDSVVSSSPNVPTVVVPTIASPSVSNSSTSPENSFNNALRAFGIAVNEKQVARIAMNTCVAWANTSEGVTVTYNPGYMRVPSTNSRQSAEALIFSGGVLREGVPKPSLSVSNGPGKYVDGAQVDDEIQRQVLKYFYGGVGDSDITHRVSTRQVSEKLVVSPDRLHGYYIDTTTRQPVIHTRFIDGPLNYSTVIPVCNQLRQG